MLEDVQRSRFGSEEKFVRQPFELTLSTSHFGMDDFKKIWKKVSRPRFEPMTSMLELKKPVSLVVCVQYTIRFPVKHFASWQAEVKSNFSVRTRFSNLCFSVSFRFFSIAEFGCAWSPSITFRAAKSANCWMVLYGSSVTKWNEYFPWRVSTRTTYDKRDDFCSTFSMSFHRSAIFTLIFSWVFFQIYLLQIWQYKIAKFLCQKKDLEGYQKDTTYSDLTFCYQILILGGL